MSTLTLDPTGRIVIPKTVRDELRLGAGDTLELESQGDQIVLRPVRSVTPLRKDRGVWVFRTGKKISASETDKALQDSREQRDRQNTGIDS